MMKLKINKACDLNSISVLPPHSRRVHAIPTVTESSSMGKSQGSSQLWSQSQQSFCQSMSMSQLSQNSQEEIMTNDLRFGSQDNSLKRISCLAPVAYTREDGQMPTTRSSDVVRRWSSNSALDHKCHLSEQLEHRMGLMENSLSRLGLVLDSVQNDILQVNKAVKDASLEMDGIRQRMHFNDSSLQQVLKGEEDIKASLDANLKAVSEQLTKNPNQYKFNEVESSILALPVMIENQFLKLQNELFQTFTKEMVRPSSIKPLNEPHQPHAIHPPKVRTGSMNPVRQPHQQHAIPPPKRKSHSVIQVYQKQRPLKEDPVAPLKCYATKNLVPETEMENLKFLGEKGLIQRIERENFKSLMPKAWSSANKRHGIKLKKGGASIMEKEPELEVIIESDEEIERGLSFLLEEKDIGARNNFGKDVNEEIDQILRRARRKRRKNSNTVIVI